ncbi:MAG: CHAT domain-containing protein, partial [Saprospiraceae bacterium]|nr:CHAT domain-containing protein [Saprospiraceae bacterium]
TAFLLEKTPEFDVETALKELHFGIHGQQDAKRQTDELPLRAMNAFKKQGYAFFKLMFEPFATRLPKSLLIAPHGILALLPFDALLMQDPGANLQYGLFEYLGKHHPISYAYSISLHQELKQSSLAVQTVDQLVGFAPEFVNPKSTNTAGSKSIDSPNFAPIPHSKIEVETIVKKKQGKGYYGNQATEANFIKAAPEAQIIHISTHTWWEPKTGLPCIVFQPIPDQEENEFLFPNEIYPLRLKADLVVFSACETGIGPVEAGGGIASLARAFSFAGARGLVTTLWKVDGLQSKELMTLFYEKKTPQSSYSEALWRAKNAYLEKFPEYVAPYYWAGFNHVGGN